LTISHTTDCSAVVLRSFPVYCLQSPHYTSNHPWLVSSSCSEHLSHRSPKRKATKEIYRLSVPLLYHPHTIISHPSCIVPFKYNHSCGPAPAWSQTSTRISCDHNHFVPNFWDRISCSCLSIDVLSTILVSTHVGYHHQSS